MSWYNPRSWFGTKQNAELTLDQLGARLALIQQTAADVTVTPKTALKSPTVYAIVNAMSRAVASLPFSMIKDERQDGKRHVTVLRDHNVTRLLRYRPNVWQTNYEYWLMVMTRLLLYGRFYARKLQAANGRIMQLQPLHPDNVTPEQMESGKLRFQVTDGGRQETVPQEKMHWINGLMVEGLVGTSPIDNIKDSIALEIAAERFGARTFGSGAIPNVIIKRQGSFKDDDALKRFKESFSDAFRKRRGTAVLEEGMEFEVVQMTNEDSQFLETRKLQRSIIAGAYGVPPHVIGDLERATFSNIESLSLGFVIHAIRPWLECVEASVSRDLLTPAEVNQDTVPLFDTRAMLRGEAKSRSEALKIQRENGVISANEWRAFEGLDARDDDDGDTYMTPLNFRVEPMDVTLTPAEEDDPPEVVPTEDDLDNIPKVSRLR